MSSINELNQLCKSCLSNIDYSEKTKVEEKLKLFVINLQPSNFTQLCNSINESSIFVIISLLINNFPQAQTTTDWLIKSIQTFANWIGSDSILRKNGLPLSYHVLGKCKQWIGQLAKSVYYYILSQRDKKDKLFKYFSNLSQQLRIFCYTSIMEAMNIIDYKLDFVSFRNLMFNFQKDWIPIMFKQATIFLKKFTQTDDLQPIILKIQNLLNLNQTQNKSLTQFSEINFTKLGALTKLLQALTDFQYNIDSNEYQKIIEYDGSPIQFPYSVQDIIIKGLHHILQTIMKRLILNFPQHPITQSFFNCFAKLSCPSNSDISLKKQGIQTSIFIMSIQKITPKIKQILLEFNVRLIRNISFSTLFLTYQPLTIKWIQTLIQLSQWILLNTNVIYKNIHVDHITRLFNNIFQGSAKKNMNEFKSSFKKISQTLMIQLCRFLFESNKPLTSDNVTDFLDMQTKNLQQFRSWIPTIFLSAQTNFELLRKVQISLYNNTQNINNILNFNLLLGYLVSQHVDCFEENIHFQQIGPQTLGIFGSIIKNKLQFLAKIKQQKSVLFHGSALYFFNNFLGAVIESFEFDTSSNNQFIQKYVPQLKQIETQKLIIQCVKQIGSKFVITNIQLNKYCFQILSQNTNFLSTHYENKFITSQVYSQLLSSYIQLSQTYFITKQTVSSRKYLFENLTTLVLYSKNYSVSEVINNIIILISKTIYSDDIVKLYGQIYDIRGMASQFKTQYHLEQFIEIISPTLDTLNKIVFCKGVESKIVKETMKIYNTIFSNKIVQKRIQNYEFIITRVYVIILPYWAQILHDFINLNDEILIQKNIELILQIIQGLTLLFKDIKCNPYNLKDFKGLVGAILTAILKSIDLLQKVSSDMMVVVKLFEQLTYTDIIECLIQQLEINQIQNLFRIHILMYKQFLQQLKCFVDKQKEESTKQMQIVNLISQGMQNMYLYIKNRYLNIPSDLKHLKQNQIQNRIGVFISTDPQLIKQLIIELFRMILLTANKASDQTTFSFISKQIKNLTSAYPRSVQTIQTQFQKQKINKKMQKQLKTIYQSCKAIRNIDQMGDEKQGDIINDQFTSDFQYLVKKWAETFEERVIVLDDY